MVDPISSLSSSPSYDYDSYESAPRQVKALYSPDCLFPDTIVSASESTTESISTSVIAEKEKKSFLSVMSDWFSSLLGFFKQTPLSSSVDVTNESSKLTASERISQENLSKAIAEINRDLTQRLEEISKFEEEMRNLDPADLDVKIFNEEIKRLFIQRDLKESGNTNRQESAGVFQRELQNLQKQHYDLRTEIAKHESRDSILKIINYGTTGATLGTLGAALVIGGTGGVLGIVGGVLSLSKAALAAFKAVLKSSNDKKMAELFIVRHEMDHQTTGIKADLTEMRTFNTELSSLLKAVKETLDSQLQAMQSIASNN